MKTPGRTLFCGFLLLIALIISGTSSPHKKNGRSTFLYDGVFCVPLLTDSVTIYTDEKGMPHIYAKNEHDVYLATGFISARERLWQMDLFRRSCTGRLSEIFGKIFLQSDIFTRSLRINEKSKLILFEENPEIIACMQAFIDGVNDYIVSCGKDLPVEFRILSYTPEPWTLEDIAGIIRLLGWNLDSRNLTSELFIYQATKKLGSEIASDLIPDWNRDHSLVYPDFKISDTLISGTRSFLSSFNLIGNLGIPVFSGSNNWAVSGKKSITGKPLLSNDIHLSLSNPGIWMQMHQVVPGKLNVTGVMIPGEPFIVAGHNEKIAWGMTNLRVDAIDLYAEKIDTGKDRKYLFNGEWRDLITRPEVFGVRGGKNDTVGIRYTHHGPVISGLVETTRSKGKVKWLGYEFLTNMNCSTDYALSFKWSGFDKSDEIRSVYILNRAEGWNDFRSGLETFRSISSNCIYADIYGNIGIAAAGGIPIRKGNGIIIRDGTTDEYDWKGYVPADQLPFSFNPSGGTVSSANNRIIDNDYPYFVSQSFDLPYRINRIREMLSEKDKFSTEDFKMMLADQHSSFARLLTPYILDLKKRADELSPYEKTALDSLSGWDYEMDQYHIAPSILEFFRIDFKRNILADELGELYDHVWDLAAENLVYRILVKGTNTWVDNINTAEN